MKKRMKIMAAVLMLTAVTGITAYAGTWDHDERGWWYQNDSGSYARSQVMQIDGASYGFDENAYMVTGWKQFDGRWYYFNGDGTAANGWQNVGDAWYYFEPAMHTGWLSIGSNRYYLNNDGVMQTGWFEVEGSPYMYRAYEDGRLIRNTTDDSLEASQGVVYRYQDDGTILYRTPNTAKTGQVWRELLTGSAQENNISDQKEDLESRVEEEKEKRIHNYYNNVYSKIGKSSYASRLSDWKTKTRSSLAALGQDSESIESFITDVLSGRYRDGYYDGDDSYYEYDAEYETYNFDYDDEE